MTDRALCGSGGAGTSSSTSVVAGRVDGFGGLLDGRDHGLVDVKHEAAGARPAAGAQDQALVVGGEPHQVELLHVEPRRRRRRPLEPREDADRTIRSRVCPDCPGQTGTAPGLVAELGHQATLLERPQRPDLGHVDHHRLARLASTSQVTTQSVHAVGVLEGARSAIDAQHAVIPAVGGGAM